MQGEALPHGLAAAGERWAALTRPVGRAARLPELCHDHWLVGAVVQDLKVADMADLDTNKAPIWAPHNNTPKAYANQHDASGSVMQHTDTAHRHSTVTAQHSHHQSA